MEPRRSDERGQRSRSPQSVWRYASSGNKKAGRIGFEFEGDPKYLPSLPNLTVRGSGGYVFASYSEGKKRPRRDDSDSEEDRERGRPKRQRGKPRMPDPGKTCGNCNKEGHTARDCIKVGRSGWMDGACPKCNRPGHLYEQCRYRDSKEDVDILFWFRMNKGPVKSAMDIGRLLQTAMNDVNQTRFTPQSMLPPPYTAKYARQIQRDQGWENMLYLYEGRPDWEAEQRVYEPQFFSLGLERIAQLFYHAGWSAAAENVDPDSDGGRPLLTDVQYLPRVTGVGAGAINYRTRPLFHRFLRGLDEAVLPPRDTYGSGPVRSSVITGPGIARARESSEEDVKIKIEDSE